MKPEKYVVSLSGGKDSTAMLLRLLEEKRPVDLILFCDTGLEFPQMYEHLAHLEAYIGRPIIRLKAEHDFEYYFLHYTPKRKNPALEQYSGMSWAGPRNRWCTGILKTRVVDAYLKELRKDYTVIEYVGIAADEPKRIKDKTYPLAEWGMTEKDCLAYCYEQGFDWGGLYEIFHRVSCWCCPLQSLDELRKLHRYGIYFGDDSIVTVALSQIGNVGGQPYWSWYGFESRVEWCACFVSWCANECGYLDSGVIPKFAGCVNGVQWFKDRGQWQDGSFEPSAGQIIFFDWDNKGSSGPQDGQSDHVGIVEKCENGIVYTIEGNSGDSCRQNQYPVGYYEILGYGIPAF